MNKNIQKLSSIRQASTVMSDTAKKEHEQLLLLSNGENTEELEILRSIGLSKHIDKQLSIKKVDANLDRAIAKYKRNVFKGSDIKKLAIEYDLVLRRASQYNGPIGIEIGKAVLAFTKEFTVKHKRNETSEAIDKSTININPYSFFILTDSLENGSSVTLFYCENVDTYDSKASEKEAYIEIASFGKPFSEFRRLLSMTDHGKNVVLTLALAMMIILLVVSVVTGDDSGFSAWVSIVFSIIAILSHVIRDNSFIKNNWNELRT